MEEREIGKLIAEVGSMMRKLETYNGQIATNNKDIVDLRLATSEQMQIIKGILANYEESHNFHERQMLKFDELKDSIEEIKLNQIPPEEFHDLKKSHASLTLRVGIALGVIAVVWTIILALPKLAPNLTPFGKQNQELKQ